VRVALERGAIVLEHEAGVDRLVDGPAAAYSRST
jgi:hypothetical protein